MARTLQEKSEVEMQKTGLNLVTKWTTLWLSQAFRGGREEKAASLKKSEVGLQKNETGEPGRSGPPPGYLSIVAA